MMKKMKKSLALLLALAMLLSLAACGSNGGGSGAESALAESAAESDAESSVPYEANPYQENPYQENPYQNNPYQNNPYDNGGSGAQTEAVEQADEYIPEAGEKYTAQVTPDGWIEIVNDGGPTLGLSSVSGVHILDIDGFAFKDLDKDGELDVYEDWREDSATRARDLASQMSGEEIAPYLTHGGWSMSFGDTYPNDDPYVVGGGRFGVTRFLGGTMQDNVNHAMWINSMEELCERLDYGIPGVVSIDPNGQSGMILSLALGATMDPDYAFELGQEYSKQYRAAGVHMLLGPMLDLANPVMARGNGIAGANGSFSEDPALIRDITEGFVSGLQSTFDENGKDLGWGTESVAAMVKHWVGAGAGEGGRDDHYTTGMFSVFPGDNFEAHLIAYADGAFHLTHSVTGSAAAIMTNYAVSYSEDGSLGDNTLAGAFSQYKYDLLKQTGFDGVICSDWGPWTGGFGGWGTDSMTPAERIYTTIELGMTQGGGYDDVASMAEVWAYAVEQLGEEAALEMFRDRAYLNIKVTMDLGLFENPYSSTDTVRALNYSEDALAYGLESELRSTVLLKNDGVIAKNSGEKPTAYVPYLYTAYEASTMIWLPDTPASWDPAVDLAAAEKYYNIVTDTVLDPSGTDPNGEPSYTEEDIQRASDAEIAACDVILMGMDAPYTASGATEAEDGSLSDWTPPSLQYAAYTAATAVDPSYAGVATADGMENRSYKGATAAQAKNYGDLEMLQSMADITANSDTKIIVLMNGNASGTMIWTEVEPLADAIIWSYGNYDEAMIQVAAGAYEPSAVLAIQMPASMEAVEAQLVDVPRDAEVYVDAAGNAYDFGYGLNWSGVIDDARVRKYADAKPLTKCENLEFFYAK